MVVIIYHYKVLASYMHWPELSSFILITTLNIAQVDGCPAKGSSQVQGLGLSSSLKNDCMMQDSSLGR